MELRIKNKNSVFFEKKQTDKTLARLTKRKAQINKIRDEKGDSTTESLETIFKVHPLVNWKI